MKPLLRRTLRAVIQAVPFRGRHRLADRLGAWLAPSAPEPFVLNGVRIELDHRELLHRLIYYGLYEENVVRHLHLVLRPGDVVFDPGANIGYFAAVALGLVGSTGHVYSFEPSNTAFARLAASAAEGPPNWTVAQAALTDHSGTMQFYDTPRVISRGFACLEGVYAPKDRMPHPVTVHALDDFCRNNGVTRIAFLKLDIEGSELNALRGATELLGRQAVQEILVETTVDAEKRPVAQAIDTLLRNAGYCSHRVQPNGELVPIDVMAQADLREDIIWTVAR